MHTHAKGTIISTLPSKPPARWAQYLDRAAATAADESGAVGGAGGGPKRGGGRGGSGGGGGEGKTNSNTPGTSLIQHVCALDIFFFFGFTTC